MDGNGTERDKTGTERGDTGTERDGVAVGKKELTSILDHTVVDHREGIRPT